MANNTLPPSTLGPSSISTFRQWIHGFTLQTLVYGINAILFLMSIWVLVIHILKASHSHRFHKHHLFQNYILVVYTTIMFAFSSIYMGHQGIMIGDAWDKIFQNESAEIMVQELFNTRVPLQRACSAALILINWGAVGILLWRCVIYWKVRSIFPSQVMALPYLLFACCIATSLLHVVQESAPASMAEAAGHKNWMLISWSISTALYYLLSLLIVVRLVYHRHIVRKQIGDGVEQFASFLTIFNESGAVILIFATAYLISLARFPNLIYLFQPLVTQLQVTLSLIIVQRITGGKAWSGKTIDCVLHPEPQSDTTKQEDVTTMGFNPNTELSSTQNDYESEHKGHHDLTIELRQAMGNKV